MALPLGQVKPASIPHRFRETKLMAFDRRGVIKSGTSAAAALSLYRLVSPMGKAEAAPDARAGVHLKTSTPFSEQLLNERARQMSLGDFIPMRTIDQADLEALNYDEYRSIRYKKEAAIWKSDKLEFTIELFHTGYIYRMPVSINFVENGQAEEFAYDADLFTFDPKLAPAIRTANAGYSGFRVHGPINRADMFDEFVVFQGASYFRAKASRQDYGLSARGLALNTARPPADEFPVFREFWIVKPTAGEKFLTVYALLDSASVCGVYKFVISSSYNTIMDVTCTLFPRRTLPYPGIAPLTSMFYFAPSNKLRVDEVRPRVHDSDGLSIVNGADEHIWRPLINSTSVQVSSFFDRKPKGFGLIQRERRPDRFQDFDARYDARPSAWVEPQGDWGTGSVELVELPTQNEYLDNIVAFWKPSEPIEQGKEPTFKYKITWGFDPPISRNLATVSQTLVGASWREGYRLFYIDFTGTEQLSLCDEDEEICADKRKNVELSASSGAIVNVAFRKNRLAAGHRLGFEYLPAKDAISADIRCALVSGGKTVSEVWIYRWTA